LRFGNPGEDEFISQRCNSERVATPFAASSRNSFRVAKDLWLVFLTQGFKANPGLELANAFSVVLSQTEVTEVCATSYE
jgi:hypothetical protein